MERVLWTLDWVAQRYNADRDRVSLRGESMGALGAMTIAMMHQERFAAIHAYVPPFGPIGGGARFSPIKEVKLRAAELPYILYTAGRTDQIVGWPPQLEFARAAEQSVVGFSFFWDRRGHIYAAAFPAEWDEPGSRPVPPLTSFSRKQSFPAISNLSVNSNPGTTNVAVRPAERPPLDSPGVGDLVGTFNGWVGWDRDTITDTAERFEITLRLITRAPADSATANVTPRRLQLFQPKPGLTYRFKVTGATDVVASGTVVADASGRITVPAVPITRDGTRLIIGG
jgi:hypothetical protein